MIMYITFLLFVFVGFSYCQCPSGWRDHKGYCYGFISQNETWTGASAACSALGTNLATILSGDENQFVTSIARNLSGKMYWLDGTDMVSEAEWVWAKTESPILYTNWHPGNPNNDHEQDCLCLLKDFDYNWDDNGCSALGHFICKQSIESFNGHHQSAIG